MTSKQSAFSLLEMSIVVAIIGLLAGTVIVGQSFVYASQITTMVNDGKYFRDAFSRFERKYSALPGDITNATDIWTGTGNGDGNGWIELSSATAKPDEIFYVWQHLTNAGLIEGLFTGPASTGTYTTTVGGNVPQSPVDNVGYYFQDIGMDYLSGVSGYFDGNYTRPLFIGKANAGNLPNNPFLKPKEAYRIDDKYDDGRPGAGNIRTRTFAVMPDCVTTNVATTAAYQTGKTIQSCSIILTQ